MGFSIGEIVGRESPRKPETPPEPRSLGLCSCGKQMYGRKSAKGLVRWMNKRNWGNPMGSYRCPLCDHYHIGHSRGGI